MLVICKGIEIVEAGITQKLELPGETQGTKAEGFV